MDSPGDRRVSLRASIDKDKSDTSGATVLEMKADGNFGSAKFSRKTSVVSTKTAGRQRKSFVEAHGDTTAIAQLSHDITGLFSAIEKCKRTRFWNVFCVRPSIEVTAGKFSGT